MFADGSIAKRVLILVVVEDSLWPAANLSFKSQGYVLILVVVEDSLWQKAAKRFPNFIDAS